MKPINKLRPILEKSPYLEKSTNFDDTVMHSLVKTLSDLTQEVKILGSKISHINVKQKSVQKRSQQKKEFITKQINLTDNRNSERRQPRFHDIEFNIPPRQNFIGDDRQNKIKQWLGMLCKDVFSVGFDIFHNQHLNTNKLKSYCSQNLLRNILQLAHVNNFTSKDFQTINNCLKNELIPYFSLKYPLTQQSEATVRFAREIVQKNNIDDTQNDLVYRSKIIFRQNQSGNYNEQIMRFINFVINLPDKTNRQLFSSDKNPEQTLYNQFFQDMQEIYRMIENKQKVTKMKSFNPKNPKIDQYSHNSINLNQESKDKDKEQYEQKVRSYTSYLIGRKISQNTKPFTEQKCKAGGLKLFNSEIMRIVTKWCEQLLNNINFDSLMSKQQMFRMRNGNPRFLKLRELQVLAYILKQKNTIGEYVNSVMDNIYTSQSHFSRQGVSPQLNMFCRSQALVGQFASVMYASNQNYLIGYLNHLIHCILSGIQTFKKFLLIKDIGIRPLDQEIDDLLAGKGSAKKLVKIIEQYVIEHQKDVEYKIPQLITFKVGDLLRSKCSSKQNQILALYRQIQRISFTSPEHLKIVRLKNRLQKGTKDILLNLLYRKTILIQIQLSIKTKETKFSQNSNKFAHYLYQLQRAQFGPLEQLCNIWINHDNRSSFYIDYFQKKNIRKPESIKYRQKTQCCGNVQNQKALSLPFRCHDCHCYYFDCNFIKPHVECKQCKRKTCVLCYFEKADYETLSRNIPQLKLSQIKINEENQDKQTNHQNFRLCREIPNYGLLVKLNSKKISINYFSRLEYNNVIYLFEHVQVKQNQGQRPKKPSIRMVSKVIPSENQLSRFQNENLIFYHQKLKSIIPQIEMQKAQLEYFIPQNLYKNLKNHATSLNLMKKSISQETFQYLPQKTVFQHVSKINFHQNNINNMEFLFDMFPNIQEVILHENYIKQIPSNIQKWKKTLKKLMLKKNQITDITNNIGELACLTQIQIHMNLNLQNIPRQIGYLSSLKSLWIRSCNIKTLPTQIGNLENLNILLLGDNQQLKQLPQQLCQLKNLNTLTIDNTSISQLPEKFDDLSSLKIFHAFNSNLKCLPRMRNLKQLKQISIFRNALTNLPQDFGELDSLQKLNAHSNQIVQLPQSFGYLKSLKILQINCNKITDLSKDFGNLKNLQKLDIKSNKLINLPDSFGLLKSIKSLYLTNNPLEKLPNNFDRLDSLERLQMSAVNINTFQDQLCGLSNLSHLSMNDVKVNIISERIHNLKKLKQLFLISTQISKIPETIIQCSNLKYLSLDNSQIQQIPAQIFKLGKLQVLRMSQNKIKSINLPSIDYIRISNIKSLQLQKNQIIDLPQTLFQLPCLQNLLLNDNKIKQIPQSVGRLSKLQKFEIMNNQITKLPKNISDLQKLIRLNLKKNHLSHFDQSITNCTNLKTLILSQNQIQVIPPQITNMHSLTYLYLSYNKIAQIPKLPSRVQKISLNSNKLRHFPQAILELPLTRLQLQDNMFTKIPQNFSKLGKTLIYMKLDQKALDESSQVYIKQTRNLMMYNY